LQDLKIKLAKILIKLRYTMQFGAILNKIFPYPILLFSENKMNIKLTRFFKHFFRYSIFYMLMLFFAKQNTAQEIKTTPLNFEFQYQYGFIAKHKPSLAYLIGGSIHAIELSISKKTNGSKYWHGLYRFPEIGISAYHVNLGNDSVLGNGSSVAGFMNASVYKRPKFSINYQISLGLGYLSKGNIAIGSHLNAYLNLCIDTKWSITPHWQLTNAFGAFHFSNGGVKMPNLGLNVFTYRLGVKYIFSPELPVNTSINPEIKKALNIHFLPLIGWKQINPPGGKNYHVYSLSTDVNYRISLKRSLGIGADISYDEGVKGLYEQDGQTEIANKNLYRTGIHISHNAYVGNLVAVIQVGAYVYNKRKDNGDIYQRLGIRYYWSRKSFFNLTLKAHMEKADCVEAGIGIDI